MSEAILQKIKDNIENGELIKCADYIAVAVSGGIDSVFLLHLLHELQEKMNLRIAVFYFNHLLRKESYAEQEFVKELAAKYNLPFFCAKNDVKKYSSITKKTLEEAARELRFSFFIKQAKKLSVNKVALAHNADDVAETVLMRFLRGCGIKGLGGINSKIIFKNVKFIRPILNVYRKDIENISNNLGLAHIEDSSNKNEIFFRNKIRHSLIPLLERQYNPSIKNILNRLASICKSDNDCLNKLALDFIDKEVSYSFGRYILPENKYLDLHVSLTYRVVNIICGMLDNNFTLGYTDFEVIINNINNKVKSFEIRNKFIFIRIKNDIHISLKKRRKKDFYKKLNIGDEVLLQEINIKVKVEFSDILPVDYKKRKSRYDYVEEYFDSDKLNFPIILRARKSGDKMKILGKDCHKKIKDILIDRKINVFDKERVIVFESSKKIFWCAPFVINNDFKIRENTKNVVKITYSVYNDS